MRRGDKGRNCRPAGRVPVVLFIHRRTWHLQRVLRPIRGYRPDRLYVFADGWRRGNTAEESACRKARACIRKQVDWPCRLIFCESSSRLGLKQSVERGLRRVFREVERAIILEDDCVASRPFFVFCEEALKKYEKDHSVMSISGSCFVGPETAIPWHAYRSRYPHCWGWATWRRAWRNYRGKMSLMELRTILEAQGFPGCERSHWRRVAGQLSRNLLSSWAYFWMWSLWRSGGRALNPAVNLVKNIGFDSTAHHTRDLGGRLAIRQGRLPLGKHLDVAGAGPSEILDRSVFQNHYRMMSGRRSWLEKLHQGLFRLVPRFF